MGGEEGSLVIKGRAASTTIESRLTAASVRLPATPLLGEKGVGWDRRLSEHNFLVVLTLCSR